MLIAAFLVGALAGGVLVAVAENASERGERIYLARHRDHASVPRIK